MKRIIKILSLIVISFLFSCEKQGFLVSCNECTPEEPKNAVLEIKLDPPGAAGTTIKIYEGNLEDNILLESIITRTKTFTYTVSLNKKYTITATYIIGGDYTAGSYTAVDSAAPGVRYSKDQCDEPCYYIYGREVNLKLKYTKHE